MLRVCSGGVGRVFRLAREPSLVSGVAFVGKHSEVIKAY